MLEALLSNRRSQLAKKKPKLQVESFPLIQKKKKNDPKT